MLKKLAIALGAFAIAGTALVGTSDTAEAGYGHKRHYSYGYTYYRPYTYRYHYYRPVYYYVPRYYTKRYYYKKW